MTNTRPTLGKRWNIIILLAYVGTAIAMTWPLSAQITTHLPGHTTDTLVHYWNGWWVRQALSAGQSLFYTPHLFYPKGLSLAYHNIAWPNVAAWSILEPSLGGLAAYNLPFLANLILCGLAAFWLTLELTNDKRAAFLAGLAYQCWPIRLGQLDHPNLISTQYIPLFLLFLHRTVRRGRWQDGLLAGVFFSLVGYTRWQQLIPAAIAGGIYLAWALLDRRTPWRRSALALLMAGAVATVALAPPILLLMRQQSAAPTDLLVHGDETAMQTDLLAYLTPSPSHPLLGTLTQSAYDRYYADRSQGRRFPAYVGATILALALLGAYKARRDALPWMAMALTMFLLALGPVLRLGGQLYPAVPMPYRLTDYLPVLKLLRFPDRFNLFLALPMAVLAAYGVRAAHGIRAAHGVRAAFASLRRRGRWANTAIPCLLGGLILFEYLAVPVPLQKPPSSPFYTQLAAEPGDFAILNLPINSQASKHYMAAQVAHLHPILQGKTARFSDETYAYLDANPWLRGLRQSNEMLFEFQDVSVQLATLAESGVRYIILHKTLVDDDRAIRWQRYLLADPQFEDEQIAVYTTRPDCTLADELIPGVGLIRAVASTNCLIPGRVLTVDVGWGTVAAPGRENTAQPQSVELALVSSDGATIQAETFPGQSAGEMAWSYYELRADPSLPTGDYAIRLALLDPVTGAPQGQPAIAGQVQVSHACTFDTPPGAIGANVLFGDDARLLGYQLRRDADQLTLILHWRAERRMETNYKIFVHIFDPTTGAPVAQDDAMPRQNTFPTTLWWPGEIVTDPIPISFEGAAAGAFGVAVGIYDPATMERLPVVNRDGHPLPDGKFVLPGETIHLETLE